MFGRPARRPDRTTAENSGRRRRRACAGNTSGGELLATLAPTAGQDRAAGAGAHPQPEAVGLGPAAVVRLERALAHGVLLLHDIGGAPPPGGGRARGTRSNGGSRTPVPRKLVTLRCGIRRIPDLRGWTALDAGRPEPSTDFRKHNRGSPAVVGRPDPDHP